MQPRPQRQQLSRPDSAAARSRDMPEATNFWNAAALPTRSWAYRLAHIERHGHLQFHRQLVLDYPGDWLGRTCVPPPIRLALRSSTGVGVHQIGRDVHEGRQDCGHRLSRRVVFTAVGGDSALTDLPPSLYSAQPIAPSAQPAATVSNNNARLTSQHCQCLFSASPSSSPASPSPPS